MKTIIITSTGRSGTTFLMLIYSYLGFHTGFNENNFDSYVYQTCNSGLERGKEFIGRYEAIKSPSFLNKMDEINLQYVSWVVIPIRDFQKAAKSREFYTNQAGGLIGNAKNWCEQMTVFDNMIAKYLQDMVKFDIPTIFLDFEKMTQSVEYLFNKITPTFTKQISFEKFQDCYQKASMKQNKRTIISN